MDSRGPRSHIVCQQCVADGVDRTGEQRFLADTCNQLSISR